MAFFSGNVKVRPAERDQNSSATFLFMVFTPVSVFEVEFCEKVMNILPLQAYYIDFYCYLQEQIASLQLWAKNTLE